MLKKLVNECKIKLTIINTGPLLVKSGYATPLGVNMTPVVTYKDGRPQVFIPGSSLKGIFRSHLERISRSLKDSSVCDPFSLYKPKEDLDNGTWNKKKYQPVSCGNKFKNLKDQLKDKADSILSNEFVYGNSCLACRLFGSTFYMGRIFFNDAYLKNAGNTVNPIELRDCVGIDRFTGGSSKTAKFDLDVVWAGMEFTTELHLRNFETWQLGGLLLILQDLREGFIRIGSGRTRGLGQVTGTIESFWLAYPAPMVQEMPATEIWGLGKFLTNGAYGTAPNDLLRLQANLPYRQNGIRREVRFAAGEENFGEILPLLEKQALQRFIDTVQLQAPRKMMGYAYLQELGRPRR